MKNSILLIGLVLSCGLAQAQRPRPASNTVNQYDEKKENKPIFEVDESTYQKKSEAEYNAELKIYPNPGTTTITLATGTEAPALIELFDVTGKIILTINNIQSTENVFTLNVAELPRGIYIVRLKFEEITIAKKIVLRE